VSIRSADRTLGGYSVSGAARRGVLDRALHARLHTAHDAQLPDHRWGAAAFAATARPQGCDKTIVTDTRITAPPERSGWVERWTYDLCGAKAEVEMTFTTSDRGGTNWSAKLVK
jgi:hypothetical protein